MEPKRRRRAPGMSPAERREMIVRTALPLVAEHGTAVTTGQIARAAGIGEATIFRVFADKEELLDACVAEALRGEHVLAEIEAIPLDQPLPARLAEAAAAVEAYLTRMGLVIGALHATGRGNRGLPGGRDHPGAGRENAMTRTRDALADLFEPERDRLRLPAEQIASLFMGLLFTRSRPPGGPETPDPLPVEAYLDVFLHGALKEGTPE
ncbi:MULTISPECIES: TetR/AcrR family transcriptional regulator [Actinomadura]|uniref:TetR/AcrR family transcriptional regulator n=1 Tax=Actinomadura TaxID=1988 RepID=UPI00052555A7|nr:TetR/AcrR family transcriptional regulator [Actinomadura madurae]MCP9955204.1 TetR/AcrR family transcriptional regulator [Actinomadura madurae]MCP9984439.1 TetR/AcrR family transcriptional regulator [Actinomadura madurae]MCQ0004001.1 TetR/AcrR family transcriptional regulator [Actinomadura madurae]URN02828.1 TetR/AcrR family transcriptional regulator [Actinomadura madurae]